MSSLPDRLRQVRQRIAVACSRAGRDPAGVALVAVTKTCRPTVLADLAALGVDDFGENRSDHLAEMAAARPPGGRFHFIGRLQSRQLGRLLPHCHAVHSLCEAGHARRLAALVTELGHGPLPVYVQVNTAGEAQKAGLAPEALPVFLDTIAATTGLALAGLMTMAPDQRRADEPDRVRRCFADLRRLAERHGLTGLSMGMSQDFEIAIEEGATVLRLGSVLVGEV